MTVSVDPALKCEGLSKSYGDFKALDDVSIELEPGEVRALLGKNGAGKSTLVRLLSGTEKPDRDSGAITLRGKSVSWANTGEARKGGIAVVHQEFSLIPELTVAENVLVGRWPKTRFGSIDYAEIRRQGSEAFEKLGEQIPLNAQVKDLSAAHQQMVEIAKALQDDPEVLILDEPTSALNSREAKALLVLVRRLAAQGVTVIYVSHRMSEIPLVADTMSVLRDGKMVATVPVDAITTEELAALIAGEQQTERLTVGVSHATDEIMVEVEDLNVDGLLEGIDFAVRRGEVVGIAGLLGSGRTEILTAIYGNLSNCTGTIRINGAEIDKRNPSKMLDLGVALIPEDRKREGIVPILGVGENMMFMARGRALKGPLVQMRAEASLADDLIGQLSLATSGRRQNIGSLSGGNQQKGVIGRALAAKMSVLLLDEPTRGIDVGAKRQLYELIRELASQGISSIFVSSELDEMTQVCDRVLVLRGGRIREELPGSEATEDRLLALTMKSEDEEQK